MFNSRMLSVMKRELKARIMTKGFIIMTVLFPALMLLVTFLPAMLMKIQEKGGVNLVIVSETPDLNEYLKAEFDSTDYVQNGDFVITYQEMDSLAFNNYYENSKENILSDKLTGIIFIPKDVKVTKKLQFYSANPNNERLLTAVRATINRVLLDCYFAGRDITREDLEYTRKRIDFDLFRVSKDDKAKKVGEGNLILSLILLMLLYMSLIFMGSFMLRSVIEEKDNRIVEILLSSVNSMELMVGKILGNAITGLLQMFIWLIPVMMVSMNILIVLPSELYMDISLLKIAYFLVNFLVGLLTFLGIFAMIGSIFDNQQDAQSSQFPVIMLILIPFYVAISLLQNPGSMIGKVASMLPFFGIMVMPIRMTLINVPSWQILISFLVNTANIIVIFYLAGKIYRVGILMSGKKPKWSEVIKWVKYKY